MRIGLLLPHFGPFSTYERLFGIGYRLAELGFSSAWVRDQLGFAGGVSFEQPNNHFVDPFITMAAIAARTEVTVGTATLTPVRQPVVLAQMVGSLSYLARGRLVLGVGLGGQPRAFRLAGHRLEDRIDLFHDMVQVLRLTSRPHASYAGRFVRFEDLTLDPPPPEDLQLWYCGSSLAGIRRALEYADGWLPGRCPFRVFDRLLARVREGAAEQGRSMRVGIVPLVSLDRDRNSALSKMNVAGILEESRNKPAWRPDGPFDTAEDLRGAVIAGNEDDVTSDLKALEDRGVDEVVLDLRERMDAFEETLERLARSVLPAFGPG